MGNDDFKMMLSPTPPKLDIPTNPKLPKTFSSYHNPRNRCVSKFCPNFSTSICNYCRFHCEKIHQGIHTK